MITIKELIKKLGKIHDQIGFIDAPENWGK